MKKNDILYLEKRGCDFFIGDDITTVSDLNNYRYFIKNIEIKEEYFNIEKKENNVIDILEVGHGARYETSKGGYRHIDNFGTWFQSYYYDEAGTCWGLLALDKLLNKGNYINENIYTKETILKLVNSISKIQYTDIKIIERY